MDRLTLVEANELCLYWIDSPPTHVSVFGIARAFGGKRRPTSPFEGSARREPRVGTDEEAAMFSEQLKALAQGIASRNRG